MTHATYIGPKPCFPLNKFTKSPVTPRKSFNLHPEISETQREPSQKRKLLFDEPIFGNIIYETNSEFLELDLKNNFSQPQDNSSEIKIEVNEQENCGNQIQSDKCEMKYDILKNLDSHKESIQDNIKHQHMKELDIRVINVILDHSLNQVTSEYIKNRLMKE